MTHRDGHIESTSPYQWKKDLSCGKHHDGEQVYNVYGSVQAYEWYVQFHYKWNSHQILLILLYVEQARLVSSGVDSNFLILPWLGVGQDVLWCVVHVTYRLETRQGRCLRGLCRLCLLLGIHGGRGADHWCWRRHLLWLVDVPRRFLAKICKSACFEGVQSVKRSRDWEFRNKKKTAADGN